MPEQALQTGVEAITRWVTISNFTGFRPIPTIWIYLDTMTDWLTLNIYYQFNSFFLFSASQILLYEICLSFLCLRLLDNTDEFPTLIQNHHQFLKTKSLTFDQMNSVHNQHLNHF